MSHFRRGGKKKSVAIVGAGPGGLATAILLAQRGFRVQVFEKQDVIGGRNAEVRLGEYRFDLGPTFLMMKFLLDELFVEGGRKSSDYLQFEKLSARRVAMYRDAASRSLDGRANELQQFTDRKINTVLPQRFTITTA